ncbi:MAG: hypothetical protein P9M14_15905 [Candidatus Alcyoniella australis]|nr:hypothetical protein [Candidatus Alcyoniella australis]
MAKKLSPITELTKKKSAALGMESFDSQAAAFLLEQLEQGNEQLANMIVKKDKMTTIKKKKGCK